MSNTAQSLASTRIASLLDGNSFVEIGGALRWVCSFLPVFFARRIAWALRCPLPLSFC